MPAPVAVFTDVGELDPAPGVRALEDEGFEVRVVGGRDPARIAAAAGDAVALITGYARVDAELLDKLPALRIVATMSVGIDMVDLDAAARRGVWVCNVLDAATEEVAVHALALILALVRRLPEYQAHARAGGWGKDLGGRLRRASGLTLGIVGLGRIGAGLARLARPVFGRLVGADPALPQEAWPEAVERMDLEELVRISDVISLHVPLEDGTRGLFDEARLRRLPARAILVNCSRGEVVDRAALVACLDDGHLGGAGLDVLAVEPPPPGDRLLHHPRAIVTPHVAFLSDESRLDHVLRPALNVIAWYRTGRPLTPVVEGRD
ncbi:MAG: C-terminal binding protein [Actinobacteria bacterium]|nr:C-terminal binding protein [Actinomycetota bacterium]